MMNNIVSYNKKKIPEGTLDRPWEEEDCMEVREQAP